MVGTRELGWFSGFFLWNGAAEGGVSDKMRTVSDKLRSLSVKRSNVSDKMQNVSDKLPILFDAPL